MGILEPAAASASTFGSYFAGYLFDIVGNYDPAFWTGIVVSTIGIVLTWALKPATTKRK
jgi:hypothetical protein